MTTHAESCTWTEAWEEAHSDQPAAPFSLEETLAKVQARDPGLTLVPCFVPAYRRFTSALAQEAHLTPVGVTVARQRIVTALANQLRVRTFIERGQLDPRFLGEGITFITGLPGTSLGFLHQLLSQHSGLNIPCPWEILSPTTEWGPWQHGRIPDDPFEGALHEQLGRNVKPPAAHFDAPHGDQLLLTYAFHTPSAAVEYHIPGYARWLQAQDASWAYEFHRYALTVILERVSGGTPVLVNDFHSMHLSALRSAYPTARIVRVHRDPLECLANVTVASMLRRRAWSDLVMSPEDVAAEWTPRLAAVLDDPDWYGPIPPDVEALDLDYRDIVKTPLLTIRRICDFVRTPLPSSIERRMLRQWEYISARQPPALSLDDLGIETTRLPWTFHA